MSKPKVPTDSLWIGGADDIVVHILGPGHKPGLKLVRCYGPNLGISECHFVGNRIRERHEAIVELDAELRELIKNPFKSGYWDKVHDIRVRSEKLNSVKLTKPRSHD